MEERAAVIHLEKYHGRHHLRCGGIAVLIVTGRLELSEVQVSAATDQLLQLLGLEALYAGALAQLHAMQNTSAACMHTPVRGSASAVSISAMLRCASMTGRVQAPTHAKGMCPLELSWCKTFVVDDQGMSRLACQSKAAPC